MARDTPPPQAAVVLAVLAERMDRAEEDIRGLRTGVSEVGRRFDDYAEREDHVRVTGELKALTARVDRVWGAAGLAIVVTPFLCALAVAVMNHYWR